MITRGRSRPSRAPMDVAAVESRITAVTVYRRGALVTRQVEVPTVALPARLQVRGLPLTLADGSVRTQVESVQGPAPIATDVRVGLAVPEEDPSLAPPDDSELREAQLAYELASARLDELGASIERLRQLGFGVRGQSEEGKPPRPSPTASRIALLEFRRDKVAARTGELADAERARHEALERLQTLKERKRVATTARNARAHEVRKAAIVSLEPSGDATTCPPNTTLQLTYFVPGARWAPAYTLRLDDDMGAAELEVRATIGQATGEDWRGVALTLSTANPQAWTELPELAALKIGRAQPPVPKTGWRPAPTGAAELYADFDRDVPPPPQPPPPKPPAPSRPRASASVRHETRTATAAPPRAASEPMSMTQLLELRAEEEAEVDFAVAAPAPQAAAAPPPAPGGMPPPAAMPVAAAPARSKSSVLGGLASAVASSVADAFGGGEGGYADAEDAPAEAGPALGLVAGRDLLDYGRMRMPGPEEAGRGTLRRAELRVLYRQTTVQTVQLEVAFREIDSAMGAARRIEARSPPPRHRWPDPEPGFDYAYVADGPIHVASDGKLHSIAVDTQTSRPMARYVTVPRETQDVFRIVSVQNPLSNPLLPGPADVYVGGKYRLTTDVEMTAAGGKVELGLGVEQAIKISRNVEFSEDTSGLIKRQHDLEHRIAIELVNHLAVAARVEVRERLPVASEHQADDIEVEVAEVQPPWDEYEDADGQLEGGRRWEVDVPAGGTRRLAAKWVISIPSQHELVGGNRRES